MPTLTPATAAPRETREVDVIVVGAGFAGLGMAVHLKRSGRESFIVLERADDIGGSWRDNTYPGVACDVPSPLYSYSFRPNPDWSRLYSPGPEIHRYLKNVAADEGVLSHLRYGADMSSARWDEATGRWTVHTPRGTYTGRVLVSATGHLTDVKFPDVPGLDEFPGDVFHSARWDHSIDLSGRRVGVVGTGASAIQIVPELAGAVSELVVFQRSAPYVRPRNDHTFTAAEKRLFARDRRSIEELREDIFWAGDQSYAARRLVEPFLQQQKSEALGHLARQVADPVLRAHLTPNYEIGCKRILVSDTYYPALQRPGVTLEPSGLRRIDGGRAVSAAGNPFDLDALVFATGFETFDLPSAHRVVGRSGQSLADRWADRGMEAYNSTTVPDFPNFFLINGPGTSLGHNSIIYMIEAQIDHVLQALEWARTYGDPLIEVRASAEADFVRSVDERAAQSVTLRGGCSSWYVDPRSGRATLSWPDFAHRFRAEAAPFDESAYRAPTQPAPAG